jgi:hypothetical protein
MNAFVNTTRTVYFWGNNVLVKVDGTDEKAEAKQFVKSRFLFGVELEFTNTIIDDTVMFSMYFDLVATAPGATDDGITIVALVYMIGFLSNNRPRGTAVFSLNNGEEDGLHAYGAQACASFMHRTPPAPRIAPSWGHRYR